MEMGRISAEAMLCGGFRDKSTTRVGYCQTWLFEMFIDELKMEREKLLMGMIQQLI